MFYDFAVVALAAALAAPAMAQRPGRGARAVRGEPLRALVQHREELKLTDQQVARIEEIASRLEKAEQPLREKLRAAGVQRPSERAGAARPSEQEREAMRQKREELRPVLEQMREARRTAMEEARQVLTSEQRAQLREHFRNGRGRAPVLRG